MADYDFEQIAGEAGAPLLVLLHGTGGDAADMLALGARLLPGATLVAPQGDVREGMARRFFRRTGEGVYDMADLARATAKLAAFMAARRQPGQPVMALGYSNGANVLANLLFHHPAAVDRAALLHPLIPFAPPPQPGLRGKPVLITAGERDPICPPSLTRALADTLVAQGAALTLEWSAGGHELGGRELVAASRLFAAA